MLGNRLTRGAFLRSLEASGHLPDCGEPVAAIVLASAYALQVVDDVVDDDGLNADSPARAGWLAAGAIGFVAESVAALPLSETHSRAILRAVAQSIGCIATMQEQNAPRRDAMLLRPTRDLVECFAHARAIECGLPIPPDLPPGVDIRDPSLRRGEICCVDRRGRRTQAVLGGRASAG